MFDDCMSIIDGIAHTLLHPKFDSFCCVHVTQGASAAVNATILLQIFLYPKGLVYLYFLIPVPAALMVRIFSLFFFLETIHCSFSCSSQNFFVSSHFRAQP
jgi:hypothetical protein